jgi:hypothetical protein
MRHHWASLHLFCILAALGCGCNRGPVLPELVPVHGTVTLDGKPLSGASIAFVPIGNTRGTGADGCTDNNGQYEVFDRRGQKGAPVGEYRVSIVKPGMSGSSHPGLATALDASPIHSGKATIPQGGGAVDFLLRSKP